MFIHSVRTTTLSLKSTAFYCTSLPFRHIPHRSILDQRRNMTSINKTENEWKAILSPEQVVITFATIFVSQLQHAYSSGFYGRRVQKQRGLVNMTNIVAKESILALDAEPLYTRAPQSSMSVLFTIVHKYREVS